MKNFWELQKDDKVRFSYTKRFYKPFIGTIISRSKKLAWVAPERYKGSFLSANRRKLACLPINCLRAMK